MMLLGVDTRGRPRRSSRSSASGVFAVHRRRGASSAPCSPCSSSAGPDAVTGAKSVTAGPRRPTPTNIRQLGQSLFTDYVFAFEITAALLTIAVVGAVVLSRRPQDVQPIPEPESMTDQGDEPLTVTDRRGRALMTVNLDCSPTSCSPPSSSRIGAVGLLVRRNPLVMLMCVELMLNAVNLTFVTFGRMLNDIAGQVIVFFVLVVAAAEVVVGPRHHRGHRPPHARRHRRRPPAAEGLGARHGRSRLADPCAAAGRLPRPAALRQAPRRARRRAGSPPPWSAPSFVGRRCVVFAGLLERARAHLRALALHLDPRRATSRSTSASCSIRCRSRWSCSSPASPR